MSNTLRTSIPRQSSFSGSTAYQEPDQAFLAAVDGKAPDSNGVLRVRYWVSAYINVLIVIGIMVSIVFLVRLWGDFQCRTQYRIQVLLPCTPVNVVTYLEEAKRPAAREVWCSAPQVSVDSGNFDCYTLQTSAEPPPAMNVTCYKARVSYRASFAVQKPTVVGTGLRTFLTEVEITRAFVFKCLQDGPKTVFNYPVAINRSLNVDDYLIASYEDK